MRQAVIAAAQSARAGAAQPGATDRPSADDWPGLSEDLIGRFLDVLAVKFAHSRASRAAHRVELHRADRWIHEHAGRTLVTASEADLREYIAQRRADGASDAALSASLRHLRLFYSFLLESHARADDPLAGLADISSHTRASR